MHTSTRFSLEIVHYAADAPRRRPRYRSLRLNPAAHLAIGVVRITTALASNAGREDGRRSRTGSNVVRLGRPSENSIHSRTPLSLELKLGTNRRIQNMRDIIFVAVTVAFFLISIAYVKFCDRIR